MPTYRPVGIDIGVATVCDSLMADLHELDALTQGDAVLRGDVSPLDLVEHYLARITAYDEMLGAFVTVTAAQARAQAGMPRPDDAGPLWGVPTAIKDNVGTAGVRTTFGSKAYEDFIPQVDAYVVQKIREAGLISLGKTNLPEFALSAYSDNSVAPSARTPWDLRLSASGSSGGAAAAVAAGLLPVAHANDGGGSIRMPASVCGLFGLKAARGRISPGPLGIDLFGLTVQGPLARTVADAAAMLDVMAGPMPGDPHWAPPPSETFLAAAGRAPGRLRIAAYSESGIDGVGLDPACRQAWSSTVELLVELGHEVEEIKNPFAPSVVDIFCTLWAAQSLRFPIPPGREETLRPITTWWRSRGRTVNGGILIDAMADAQLIARKVVTDLFDYDAVVTPTLGMQPQPSSWFTDGGGGQDEIDRQTQFSAYCGAANLTGQPAANVPLYWTDEGLPIGTMITGRPAGEAALLSLCAQLEQARPWAHRRAWEQL